MENRSLTLRTSASAATASLKFSLNGLDRVDAIGAVHYLRDGSLVAGDGLLHDGLTHTYEALFFDGTAISPTSIDADWKNDFTGFYSEALVVVRWRTRSIPSENHWITVLVKHVPGSGFNIGPVSVDDEALEIAREAVGAIAEELTLHTPSASPDGTYFSELNVSGYRGFAAKQTLRMARPVGKAGSGMTVLVGSNNSGKSTFIEALHYLARGGVHAETTFPQTRRNNATNRVDLSVARNDGTRLSVSTSEAGGSLAESRWLLSDDEETKFEIHVTPSRRNFNPFFGNMGPATRDWNITNQEPSRTEQRDYFPSRLREIAQDSLRRTDFDRILKRIIGRPLNWTIDEFATGQSYIQLIDENNQWHTSEGLGDGLVSLLFIAEALHDSQPGSLIALDEPELSLHPQLVRRLGRVLSEYASDRQIIVATHSPIILNWTDIANGAAVARVFKKDGASLVAQPSKATMDRVVALSSGNLSNPHTLGVLASEAFFLEDGLILLEGQEDVALLPDILGDLGLAQSDNVFGWGVGGATNMPIFAELFLEIGFTRITAILDDDAQEGTNSAYDSLSAMGEEVLVQRIPAADVRNKPARDGRGEIKGLFDRTTRKVHEHLRDAATRVYANALAHVDQPPNTSADSGTATGP